MHELDRERHVIADFRWRGRVETVDSYVVTLPRGETSDRVRVDKNSDHREVVSEVVGESLEDREEQIFELRNEVHRRSHVRLTALSSAAAPTAGTAKPAGATRAPH